MENEIVLFETNDNAIKLEVPVEGETVWLSANQMAELFDRDEKTIRKHINNVFSEAEVDKDNNTQKMHVVGVKQEVIRIMKRTQNALDSQQMRFGAESDLFGKEKDDSFKGSIGNIYQSFSISS